MKMNYPTIFVGPQLVEVVSLAHMARQPVLLIGGVGVGKSESLKDATEKLKIGFIERDLSLLEPVDLMGIPFRDSQAGTTRYAPPSCLPTKGNGLFSLEELNRSSRAVRNSTLLLLSARSLNDYCLPEGWSMACSVNPDNGENDVDQMDPALTARFVIYYVEPHVKYWLAWAEEHQVHPAVIEFVRQTPQVFNTEGSNPRGWCRLSKMLQATEQTGFGRGLVAAHAAGCVGPELGFAFARTYTGANQVEVPPPQRVLTAYAKVRASVRRWAKEGKTDALESLTFQLLLYLQDPGQEEHLREDARELANLRQCMGDLPAEFRRRLLDAYAWLEDAA